MADTNYLYPAHWGWINNINFSATLYNGLSFTIIPAKHFQQLKIQISKLNTEKHYSIQSASQMVKNAVQGTIISSVKIKNFDNSFQFIDQTFLVLQDTLTLPTILLGNDFMGANNSQIIYDKNRSVSLCQIRKIRYQPFPGKSSHTLKTCNLEQLLEMTHW